MQLAAAMLIKVAFVLFNRMDRLLENKMLAKSYGFFIENWHKSRGLVFFFK